MGVIPCSACGCMLRSYGRGQSDRDPVLRRGKLYCVWCAYLADQREAEELRERLERARRLVDSLQWDFDFR